MLSGLRKWFGSDGGWRSGKRPSDLSIALGVPLVLGLLMGILGWPVPWYGHSPRESPPPPVAAGPAMPAETEVLPGRQPASNEEENLEVSRLEEQLALAHAAQLESARALAGLRSRHEGEVSELREERNNLALGLAARHAELAALRAVRAREAGQFNAEREEAGEKIRRLEREILALKMAEKRRAESEEELRRCREEPQRENQAGDHQAPGEERSP